MINSSKINSVQRKIKNAIAEIEKEENVKISFGTCRYDAVQYGTRMTVKTLVKSDVTETVDVKNCKRLGLPSNVIGMTFKLRNATYRVDELKMRNRKYPIIAKNLANGKSYKFTPTSVKSYLGTKLTRKGALEGILG